MPANHPRPPQHLSTTRRPAAAAATLAEPAGHDQSHEYKQWHLQPPLRPWLSYSESNPPLQTPPPLPSQGCVAPAPVTTTPASAGASLPLARVAMQPRGAAQLRDGATGAAAGRVVTPALAPSSISVPLEKARLRRNGGAGCVLKSRAVALENGRRTGVAPPAAAGCGLCKRVRRSRSGEPGRVEQSTCWGLG